jgi:phosphotransferase system enzyme I (PtsI)
MLKLKGLGVSAGEATGPVLIINLPQKNELSKVPGKDLDELERFEKTLQITKADIEAAHNKLAKDRISESEIFDVYLQMLDDEEFSGAIRALISHRNMKVEDAIEETINKLSAKLGEANSEYIRSRTKDIDDLGDQLIKNMMSEKETVVPSVKPSIIVTIDLKATDLGVMDKGKILGIVTEEGSPISHVSILARALKIPAVIKCQNIVNQVANRDIVFVNGSTGEVIINP